MGQIIAIILVAAVALYAIKLAFLFLILAGLIFRTKQTVGLLVLLAAWALFWKAPVVSCILIGFVAVVTIYKAATKKSEPEKDDPTPRLIDETSN